MGESSILRRLMIVYFFTFMAAPVSYLIRVLYARSLSLEAYGLFYSIIALVGLIGVFNDLGMNPALVHYLPKFIKHRSFNKIRAIVSLVFSVEIITAIILAGIIFSMRTFLAESFFRTNLALAVLPVFSLFFLVNNVFDLLKNIFSGYRLEKYYSSMTTFRLFLVLLISSVLSLTFKENLVLVFAWTWVFSFLASIIFFYFPLSKLSSGIFRIGNFGKLLRFDKEISSMLLKYGCFVMISVAASTLLGRIDVLMITYFKGVTSVAFYEIALPIAGIIITIIYPVILFLFPHISHYYHAKKFSTIKAILRAIYNTGFFMFLPVGLVFFLFPQEIITVLFGSKYLPAKAALQILAIGFIFKGFSLLNFAVTSGIGKVKKKSSIILFGGIINIILNLMLIPSFGIEGAALATTISFLVLFIMSLYYLEKKIKFSPSYKNWLKTIADSALFIAVVYSLKTVLNLNLYLEAIIVVMISGLIYLLVGFKWKILDYNNLKRVFIQTIRPEKQII